MGHPFSTHALYIDLALQLIHDGESDRRFTVKDNCNDRLWQYLKLCYSG